jgi:hypothetical protein
MPKSKLESELAMNNSPERTGRIEVSTSDSSGVLFAKRAHRVVPFFDLAFLALCEIQKSCKKELIPKIHPAIPLRFAYEIFRNDDGRIINLLVLNGWVQFDDPNTGINTKAYTASLMVERNQIEPLNLRKLDPLAAFQGLNAKSAGRLTR